MAASALKKVLMIAFIYPPVAGSGVQRTLKFTRYLPLYGWQPVVVCGDDGEVFDDGYDPSLAAEIPPEALVHRVPFHSPLALRRWVIRKLFPDRIPQAAHLPQPARPADAPAQTKGSILRRLGRLLAAPLAPIEFPPVDAALYWAVSIVPACLRLIRQHKIEAIYSSSFPYSDHVAAYLLKRLTGLPWVADFRDPWSKNLSARNTGWRYWVDCRVERKILHAADRVVSITPSITQWFAGLAPARPRDHFITITNGFDAEDLPARSSGREGPRPQQTVIAHIGKIYDGIAQPLLEGLARLPQAERKNLQIRFVGGLDEQAQDFLCCRPEKLPVAVDQRLPHQEALRIMLAADILLLLISGQPGWEVHYPGKIFEYMASGKPVLMIGPEGEAANLIRSSGTGCFVPAADQQAVVETLRLAARSPQTFTDRYYHPNEDLIRRYERRTLTASLANVLEQARAGSAHARQEEPQYQPQ